MAAPIEAALSQVTSAMAAGRYVHPQHGVITVTNTYSDLWVGTRESDGEIVSCLPQLLKPVGGPAIIDVQVSEVVDQNPIRPLNINEASPKQLSDFVVGIGPAKASKIITRRPPTGYEDFDHLARLNSDLGLDWEAIATDNQIEF